MGDRLVIKGGNRIEGKLEVSGAKNACLPLMAASILSQDPVELDRVPDISDVRIMIKILEEMGVIVDYDHKGHMYLDARNLSTTRAPEEYVVRMNASFDVMGPLLSRHGHGEVSLPGGCKLGPRPVDMHIDAFKAMGAEVVKEGGFVKAKCPRLKGCRILFPKVSVGATKNSMMAATLAEGVTTLENCAREPEITDLAQFLVSMGAKIEGIGTQTLHIEGVSSLHGTKYSVISDRIEAGTFMLAGAITEGDVFIDNISIEMLENFVMEMRKAGQEVIEENGGLRVKGHRPINPLDITTAPYPGFPTDLHPPMAALLALGNGTSIMNETIFNGRYMYVMELGRLGADILVNNQTARIIGVKGFVGAPVDAPDIRAGGALLLAGLAAEGETTIRGVRYIDRGYQHIEERLRSLGADIVRVKEPLTPLP
ncbi:UDP-N-acetylglucosamine 1-carboxyvinyltransferase [bacterium]|nr:UDP-N-acetylglucosamine 1-carboxyvinyltransferase [bacterium]